jgi:mannose-6-phosphate isomerase-like protein (cupin superfamily)
MARLILKEQLPHLHSTRDTRDRLDLVKPEMPLGARRISADRIRYHPGDTAAAHYHTGSHHLFYILEGEGLMYIDGSSYRMKAGMAAVVGPGEVHWFHNDTRENFTFVEFWAPPPAETVWVTDDC